MHFVRREGPPGGALRGPRPTNVTAKFFAQPRHRRVEAKARAMARCCFRAGHWRNCPRARLPSGAHEPTGGLAMSIDRAALRVCAVAASVACFLVAAPAGAQPAAPAGAPAAAPAAQAPPAPGSALYGRPESPGAMRLAPITPPPIPTAADRLPVAKLKAPPGFKVEVFAAGVANARSIRIGEKGTVFVGSRLIDKVHAIREKDGKREVKVIASLPREQQLRGAAHRRGGHERRLAPRLGRL